MAMYAQGTKRQKTRDARTYDSNEFFPGITRLEHRPDAGVDDSLCFRHYNPGERVHGRTMEEWIRPAVSLWHTFHYQGTDSHGTCTFTRSWDETGQSSQEIQKRRVKAAFELCTKLGVKLWSGYDRDLCPEGDTLEETQQMLDEAVEMTVELQQKCNVKPLWFGCNLFQHPRYMNGAATNPDAQVVAYAAAQAKKALEVAHKLGAENFLVWGGREGFQNPLIADMAREMRLYARFLKMIAEYKEKLGYRGQLLLRPGPHRECRDGAGRLVDGRYDYDAMSALCLLKHHGLERSFKLSVTPGREHLFAAAHYCSTRFSAMGSVNVTSNWKHSETILNEPYGPEITLLFKSIVEQGGLQTGGCSMELSLRRESTDLKDVFVLHAQTLDVLARSLKSAQRYAGFGHGLGQRLLSGEATLEECEEYAKRHGEPSHSSAHTEHWAAMFRFYNTGN